jgi:hypothetical protein
MKAIPLTWRRDRDGWLLLAGRRRFGRVVPDQKHEGMWRSVKPCGQLSDMANLSWAKNAVLIAAERELDFEDRQRRATDPSNCPVNGDLFAGSSTLVRQNHRVDVGQPKHNGAGPAFDLLTENDAAVIGGEKSQ